jgi:mRNA-degrading endonuclease RelE of RelBE toxin-antitoxin system
LALRRLEHLPREIAQNIIDKIEWLCSDVNAIKHSRLKGGNEFSLHSGQYRIIYLLDHPHQRIDILDIGKHDETYKRLQNRQKT